MLPVFHSIRAEVGRRRSQLSHDSERTLTQFFACFTSLRSPKSLLIQTTTMSRTALCVGIGAREQSSLDTDDVESLLGDRARARANPR